MADIKLWADEILKHFGNYENLCLENVIHGSDDENEIKLFNPSTYYLNAQSVNANFETVLLRC